MPDPIRDEDAELLASIKQRPSRLNAKPIASVMRKLMSQKGYGQTQSATLLQERWTEIVGNTLASVTQPGNVNRGVLQVYTNDSVVGQELNFQKRRILAELGKQLPELKISDIRARMR